MSRLILLLPLLLFAVVGVAFAIPLFTGKDPSKLPSALIDRPVPSFSLPAIGGQGPGLSSADLVGQVSIVNIFASWCAPCRVEHPLITRLAEEDRVPVHGINYKDQPVAARTWLDRLGNPYSRIGADIDGRIAIDWGVYGVPETFVIDHQGHIRHRHVGPLGTRDVTETILPLVQELRRQQAAGGAS